ncbi:MAG: L-seryl-tRNA(Sec) selenium transferase [Acidobacteria bacterium]|nr:L-seryl-tRNA(Sec) selenium transferase [Acidobacteriota bacterium]
MTPRDLPSIDVLWHRAAVQALVGTHGEAVVRGALRGAVEGLRAELVAGTCAAADAAELLALIDARTQDAVMTATRPSLRAVLNATGVVLHTNLGRAPLPAAALDRIRDTAGGYSNLEYDLATGTRGSRTVHAEALLTRLTGAEAALVVNNNAAAMLLVLSALAAGREAIISRGELVEIGGGFRVPDVMAQSGAILREVGTTNRTRAVDYRVACGPRTALLLRVHPSNFRVEGFTERPALADLVAVARAAGVPIVEDLGSGALVPGVVEEPDVATSLAAGVDLVCFSGDKLLGGPQAGLIVGRQAVVAALRRHPLMRALRVDKLTYAALEATLLEHLAGRATVTVPAHHMLAMTADVIEARARALGALLSSRGWRATIVAGHSAVGGGSAPGASLPTALLAIAREPLSASALKQRLRKLSTPVIARVLDDVVVLDLRTIPEDADEQLATLIAEIA